MSTAQAVKNAITLKGSATIIADYLSKYKRFNSTRIAAYDLPINIISIFVTKIQNTESIRFYFNVAFIQPRASKATNNMALRS